jgi:hypothetical protein
MFAAQTLTSDAAHLEFARAQALPAAGREPEAVKICARLRMGRRGITH